MIEEERGIGSIHDEETPAFGKLTEETLPLAKGDDDRGDKYITPSHAKGDGGGAKYD